MGVAGARRGFTVLEILLVMGIMAILMGIGVGYLQNIGSASRAEQSRSIFRQTIYACKQSSNGGTRAILELRSETGKRKGPLLVGASVARPVLTHDFESLDGVSSDFPLEIDGPVEIEKDGHTGHAARFKHGGTIAFAPQSAFAVTEGLEIDVWLRPEGQGTSMTILKADGAYELRLVQDPQDATRAKYDVVLLLQLRGAGKSRRTVGLKTEFKTKGGPIRVGQGWKHLQVAYHGVDATIRVDGVDFISRRKRLRTGTDALTTSTRRQIAVPTGGAVRLTISDSSRTFVGLMDSLVLAGVFRSQDEERELDGVVLADSSVGFPARIYFQNGRLDQDKHKSDVLLSFEDEDDEGGTEIQFRLGRHGTVAETEIGRRRTQ